MSSRIVVQKYGGSSVADLERLERVAEKVLESHRAGHQVVVVVSAMGKTTDGLLAQARQVDAEPPRRELDMLVSTGERVSMALLSIAIQKRGVPSISFTGSQAGIITTDAHFDARIVAVRPHRVLEELERGKIVIVAGYQGVSEKKEVTTLGRGGSDTTAVALAAALNAERCEIYSDVDGVYTADPRVVPDAKHLPEIDYELLQTMAESGAKVLNAQAVEWAKRAGIEIHARHTSQSYAGARPAEGSKQTVVSGATTRRPAAVSGERGLVLVTVHGTRALSMLGEACVAAQVSPREIVCGADGVTALFSLLNAPDWPRARRVLGERLPEAIFREGLAAATAVGDGLTGIHGPLAPHRMASLTESGLVFAIVGPLRATMMVEEPNLDALVRAAHAAVVPS
ncbi:MAG: aspartate kinase [Polyangiales bacterium]